jgi:hypothetical protein
MGRTVIVVYRPKRGKEDRLLELIRNHMNVLSSEDLITDRKPIVMKSSEGIFIEVFEWKSAEAIKLAHTNRAVGKLWEDFSNACDYEIPVNVTEFHNLFSEFETVNIN